MEDLLDLINATLRARRWSARQASIEAVGNDQLIRNMRRGQVPSVEKFRALCAVLGLEFYVGPPREVGSVDEQRLKHAIVTTEQTLHDEALELEFEDKAQVIAAVYELMDQGSSPSTVARVKRLVAGLSAGTRVRRERKTS